LYRFPKLGRARLAFRLLEALERFDAVTVVAALTLGMFRFGWEIGLIVGLSMFAYGVNMSLFLAGGMEIGAPPLLNVAGPYRDPLPPRESDRWLQR
jgi:multisubunit Na+/H+ antiporter MnhC subunit